MTDIKRVSMALLAPLIIVSSPLSAQAEDTVIERTTVIETTGKAPAGSSSISLEATKSYSLKFKQRLNDLTTQNDTAQSKGWITADEHSKLAAEVERLKGIEAKIEAAGFPKADVDDLEKQVTKLNADLSTASNKQPKSTAPTSSTTSTKATAAAKKTAAGDTKTKTTTTKKTTTPAKK